MNKNPAVKRLGFRLTVEVRAALCKGYTLAGHRETSPRVHSPRGGAGEEKSWKRETTEAQEKAEKTRTVLAVGCIIIPVIVRDALLGACGLIVTIVTKTTSS